MKRKSLSVVSFVLMTAGIAGVCGAQVLADRGMIGSAAAIAMKIAGVLCIMGLVVYTWKYLDKAVEEDEELQRVEQDERNEMIRGKVAQDTVRLMTMLMLFVQLVLICLSYVVPALIVAVATLIGTTGQVIMISRYQKKY